jgi:hypothetical protein
MGVVDLYSRRHVQRGRGESASLSRLGISAVGYVLSLLTIAIVCRLNSALRNPTSLECWASYPQLNRLELFNAHS